MPTWLIHIANNFLGWYVSNSMLTWITQTPLHIRFLYATLFYWHCVLYWLRSTNTTVSFWRSMLIALLIAHQHMNDFFLIFTMLTCWYSYFWSMCAGTNSRGYMEVGLVIHLTNLFRPYNEEVIYVDIKIAKTQVDIRTLTPTYVHIVAT